MRPPRHLLSVWNQLQPRLRKARRVCLFMDFDGTLAPISSDPGSVRLAPGMRPLLSSLIRKRILLGIVSGRSLAYLRRWVRLRGVWYAGSHGGILGKQTGPKHYLAPSAERSALRAVSRRLQAQLAGMPGIRIKAKEASVAVHYRVASGKERHAAARALREELQRWPRLGLLPGKKVWEIMPETSPGKWEAIGRILRITGRGGPEPPLLVFVGDDLTDERVFSAMRGLSIVVGRRRRTAARYYVRSTAEVRRFLELLNGAMP